MQPEGVFHHDDGKVPASLSPGQLVGAGRYELRKPIAKGGMGSIWLAFDSRLQLLVALKYLPSAILHGTAAFREMQREAAKSRQLSHPNIIRIYDLSESPGEPPFITMEYVEGNNLHDLAGLQANHLFTWAQIKPWVKPLCDALSYAHEEGLIHRDLKPANLMVDKKGRLKLADFGISMRAGESGAGGVAPTSGTLGYMSPQQMIGHAAHVSDDIHALGATLYELLTGRRPFESKDVYGQVLKQPAKPLNETLWEQGLINDIPAPVSSLIMACLAKDPAMRPANARIVAEWLELGKDEPSGDQYIADTIGSPSSSSAGPSSLRSWRWSLPVAFGVMALVAAVLFVSGGKPPPPLSSSAPSASVAVPVLSETMRPPVSLLDEVFNPPDGLNAIVYCSAVQSDGKYVVAGDFTKAGLTNRSRVARYNADGTLDLGFAQNLGTLNQEIYAIAVQRDGKIIIGGQFSRLSGQRQDHIARLHPNGSLDRTFVTQIPAWLVDGIAIQPDGKIVITGRFTQVEPGKHSRNRIARLNPDGTLDETFDPGVGADDAVDRVALQPDGRMIIGGIFTKFNGMPRPRLARLLSNGSLDASFQVGTGLSSGVYGIKVQQDGKVLVSGTFTNYNGVTANRIVRLLPDGGIDKTFSSGLGANGLVASIDLEGPDKIWIAGDFTSYDGMNCGRILRLNENGTRDATANLGTGANGLIRSVVHSPGHGTYIAGNFTTVDDRPRQRIARFKAGAGAEKKP